MLVHPMRYTESIFYREASEYFDEVSCCEEVQDAIWASRLVRRKD